MTQAAQGWARVLLWVVPGLWSTNYLIARASEDVIAPHALAFGRWGLAALLLLPFTARGLLRQREALRQEWKHLVVLGILGMWICGAWMYHGGQRTSATNMALIYAVTPIAIAIVGARLLHERMLPRQWFGAVLALVWCERLPQGAGFVFHQRPFGAALPGLKDAGEAFDLQAATAVNQAMETLIREAPGQYLWGYRRYKQPRKVHAATGVEAGA